MLNHIVGKSGADINLALSTSAEITTFEGCTSVCKYQLKGTSVTDTLPSTILDPQKRIVSIDLDGVSPGEYILEIEITSPGGATETYPDSEILILTILPGL